MGALLSSPLQRRVRDLVEEYIDDDEEGIAKFGDWYDGIDETVSENSDEVLGKLEELLERRDQTSIDIYRSIKRGDGGAYALSVLRLQREIGSSNYDLTMAHYESLRQYNGIGQPKELAPIHIALIVVTRSIHAALLRVGAKPKLAAMLSSGFSYAGHIEHSIQGPLFRLVCEQLDHSRLLVRIIDATDHTDSAALEETLSLILERPEDEARIMEISRAGATRSAQIRELLDGRTSSALSEGAL